VGVIDERHGPMIGQPGRDSPLATRGFPKQLGWTDTDCVRPVIGIRSDWPAIEAPFAGADEAVPIGVKQHGLAETRLVVGQLTARVGLPEAAPVATTGRDRAAVGAEAGPVPPGGVPPLGTVAEHPGVERPALRGRGHVTDADLSANYESQP